jgi:hypothetical protein
MSVFGKHIVFIDASVAKYLENCTSGLVEII